ncbi:DsbA family oxidoreductase [soil metagenome]
MKVEIWSDIMCPFCYIGKRRFEKALLKYEDQSHVQIIWRSFLLQPKLVYQPGKTIFEFLSESKGMSLEQAKSMTQQVTNMAAGEGLDFNFDKIIVANSFDAHRLIHLGTSFGLQDKVAEHLFSAHFTEGKNVQDHQALEEIAAEIGIEKQRVKKMLISDEFSGNVNSDVLEAQKLGIQGVPFFVFNRKYSVSGAQSRDVFLEVLQKVNEEERAIEEKKD